MMTIPIALHGASGRMGRFITELLEHDDRFDLVASLSRDSDLAEMLGAEVMIDVSHIDAAEPAVSFAVEHGLNVVTGTSGWNQERLSVLSARVPPERGVAVIPNFSIGSSLATWMSALAAKFFTTAEIIEAHHEGKVDAPSGTAVRTAELMRTVREDAGVRTQAPPTMEFAARGEEIAGIPIHSMRLAGITAEQRAVFTHPGEVLEIRHQTLSQDAYAFGILQALAAAPSLHGVHVGLEQLLGLPDLLNLGAEA